MTDAKWRLSLLPLGASVKDAIQSLNQSRMHIVIAVEAGDLLVGTITDGDIRRGILRGVDLSSPLDAVLQREPFVVPPQFDREAALAIMVANDVHQLPIVDAERRVLGLHLRDALQEEAARPNTMVIMAGGKGTRLRPHTEHCPKPMLTVGGKPMLEHIIERGRADGLRHFVIATHYLGEMIEDHFADGARLGVAIRYLREQEPLGTGGALSLLEPRPTNAFVVTNGDVLTNVSYGHVLDFHHRHGAVATMAVRPHEWQHPFGVVRTEGMDITGFDEKPIHRTHVNAGIYVMQPSVLDLLAIGARCDIPTLFERLRAGSHRTIAYPVHEPWRDVGHPDDLAGARFDHR